MSDVATSTERIKASVDGGIGRLVLNKPEKHNALSADMFAAIGEVMAAWEADPGVRVIVVRGAGDRAFASGADIGDIGAGIRGPRARSQRTTTLSTSKPVIALIHGYCIGGGLMVAMEADLRYAADDARFGIPAARLGAGYPAHSVRRLVGLVGVTHAASILLTGDQIDAETAARIGLVNAVKMKAELDDFVDGVAERLSTNAPLAMAASKAAITNAAGVGPGDDDVSALITACWSSADFAEGRAAFAEKRPAQFTGR
jgi:enoyl-CoA hydratase/carnithine racemase